MIGALGVVVAALVVGVTGFGFNLLAVPLLTLLIPAKEAVVVALVTGFIVNSVLAISGWRSVRRRLLGIVLIGSLPGIAVGALVFTGATDQFVKLVIAALTGIFALQILVKPATRPLGLSTPRLIGVGLLSGALTAISGMGGPPLVAYLSQAVSEAKETRATIAAYSSVSSFTALVGILITGSLEMTAVTSGLLYVIPGLIGLVVGSRFFSRRQDGYHRFVALTLLVVAVVGVSSAVAGL